MCTKVWLKNKNLAITDFWTDRFHRNKFGSNCETARLSISCTSGAAINLERCEKKATQTTKAQTKRMKGQKKMEEEGGRPLERPVLVLTVSQLKYMLIGAILALLFNNLMISSTSFHVTQNCAASDIIPADFFSSSDSRLSKVTALEKASALESLSEKAVVGSPSASSLDDGPKLLRNSRVLIGIFTMDSDFDASHRKWHRNLFNNVWNDERVCTLGHFRASNNTSFRQKCEVIYTFVAGANEDPNAPTERLRATDTATTPIELPRGYKRPSKPEINNPDVTHLNIR